MRSKWNASSSPDTKTERKSPTKYHLCVLLVTLLMVPVLPTFNFPCIVAATEGSYEYGKCGGSMAECGDIAEEFSMESETSKRILAAGGKFISPGALRENLPVCPGRGRPSTQNGCISSPVHRNYQRGCTRFYKCRSPN